MKRCEACVLKVIAIVGLLCSTLINIETLAQERGDLLRLQAKESVEVTIVDITDHLSALSEEKQLEQLRD